MPRPHHTSADLERLHRVKQSPERPTPSLGPELLTFFMNSVERKHSRIGKIADCWEKLVPPMLLDHCALESLSAGTLRVIVDSSPHLYELKQVLLAGVQDQLLLACKSSGLRRITLKLGRWYQGDCERDRKIRF